MAPKIKDQNQGSLFFSLRDTLDPKHPLFVLANQIQWDIFEQAFKGYTARIMVVRPSPFD